MSERTAGGHLGESLAALIDGELDHLARERALAHLTHCSTCRAEADAHRRLKARLTELRRDPSEPGADLLARLTQLSATRQEGAGQAPQGGPVRQVGQDPHPPWAQRSRTEVHAARRPPHRAPRRRLGLAGGALLAAGAVLVLTAPGPTSGPAPAVDPTSPVFVSRYASLTSEVPLTEPSLVVVPVGAAGRSR